MLLKHQFRTMLPIRSFKTRSCCPWSLLFATYSTNWCDRFPYWSKSEIFYQRHQTTFSLMKIDVVPELRHPVALHPWLIRIKLPGMQVNNKVMPGTLDLL